MTQICRRVPKRRTGPVGFSRPAPAEAQCARPKGNAHDDWGGLTTSPRVARGQHEVRISARRKSPTDQTTTAGTSASAPTPICPALLPFERLGAAPQIDTLPRQGKFLRPPLLCGRIACRTCPTVSVERRFICIDCTSPGGPMKNRFGMLTTAALVIGGSWLVALSPGAASASSSKAPITIALITSESGPAASEFSGCTDRLQGAHCAAECRRRRRRPQAGTSCRRRSNDQCRARCANRHLEGMRWESLRIARFSLLLRNILEQAGVPVTGASVDGPEWGTQPYTNMFASDTGSLNPKYPANTALGDFLKSHGGTVLGSYAYGVVPSSVRSANGTALSFERAGGKQGVLDTSIPFGSVAMTLDRPRGEAATCQCGVRRDGQ